MAKEKTAQKGPDKPLDNPRYEQFAQLVAKGTSHMDAYIQAGFKTTKEGASASSARLLGTVRVAERVEYLKKIISEKALNKAVIEKTWIIEKLVENVDKAMQAVPVLDRKGNETGEYIYAGSVANRSLELLGKEVGMFKGDDPQGNQTIINIIKISDADSNPSK